MSVDQREMQERLHALETAQATQAATQAGAATTQAAGMAGLGAAVIAGAAGFVAGMLLGLLIRAGQ